MAVITRAKRHAAISTLHEKCKMHSMQRHAARTPSSKRRWVVAARMVVRGVHATGIVLCRWHAFTSALHTQRNLVNEIKTKRKEREEEGGRAEQRRAEDTISQCTLVTSYAERAFACLVHKWITVAAASVFSCSHRNGFVSNTSPVVVFFFCVWPKLK